MTLRTPEQKFWSFLKVHLPGDKIRVEGSSTGMPDVNVCWNGVEVWIELKTPTNRVLIRKEQYAWGIRRAHAGGRVFVFARFEYGPDHIWRYPFAAFPYGTARKYVTTAEPSHHKFGSDDEKLRAILFE